jgi:quaternary ammonium compound-resistance protein SugE
MAWLLLFIAGLLEVVWAVGLKYTDGWTRLWPSVFTIVVMLIDFFILSAAMKNLPVGTAYAVWTGIGAVGTAIAGIVLFNESREVWRLVCITLIVAGIVGLRLTAPADTAH